MNCRKLTNNVAKYGVCPRCHQIHWYNTDRRFMGKVDGYNIKWKQKKDWMRNKHHNDLLQPYSHGQPNDEYIRKYGKLPVKNRLKNRHKIQP